MCKSRTARGLAGINRGSRRRSKKKPHAGDGHADAINSTSASAAGNTAAGAVRGGSSIRPITSNTATISAAALARPIYDNDDDENVEGAEDEDGEMDD